MRKINIGAIIVIVFAVLLFPFTAFAQQDPTLANNNEINIETAPKDILFNISNAKPGDWATRSLKISNAGEQNFNYSFTKEFKSGSKKFYNQLALKIVHEGSLLFDGKLKDFDHLKPRFLESGDSEEITITVTIPYELGNEYQGLGTVFLFKLIAEGNVTPPSPKTSDGSSGETPVSRGGWLPQTGESAPTLLYIIGGILLASGSALYLYSQKRRRQFSSDLAAHKGGVE